MRVSLLGPGRTGEVFLNRDCLNDMWDIPSPGAFFQSRCHFRVGTLSIERGWIKPPDCGPMQ